jgi:hypothetical protein
LIDDLIVDAARLDISTLTHLPDYLLISSEVERRAPQTPNWAMANFDYEVEVLQNAKVDSVFWPHDITRKHMGSKVKKLVNL